MRQQAVLHKLGALYLNVAVGATRQLLNKMRRHAEQPADLDHRKLPRLKHLCSFVAAAQLVGFHAVGQHARPKRTVCTTVDAFPVLSQLLGRFHRNRVVAFKDYARSCTVAKISAGVIFQRFGQADDVREQPVGRDWFDAILGGKPQRKDLLLAVLRLPSVRLAVQIPHAAV